MSTSCLRAGVRLVRPLVACTLLSAVVVGGISCGGREGVPVRVSVVDPGLSFVTLSANTAFANDPASAVTVTVTLIDTGGNPIPNMVVNFTSAGVTTTITPVSATTGFGGMASATVTVPVNQIGTATITVIADPAVQAVPIAGGTITFNFDVPASILFLVQPSDVAVATTVVPPVEVSVIDQFGNTVTAATTDQITLVIGNNPSAGTLTVTSPQAIVSGVATFSNIQIDTAGPGYTLVAEHVDNVGTPTALGQATSNPFSVGVFAFVFFAAYRSVPATISGLDWANVTTLPIRGARVELLDSSTFAVLDSAVTTDNGSAVFASAPTSGSALVRVYAETITPPIQVTSGGVYVMDSAVFDLATTTTLTLTALTGYDFVGGMYTSARVAAPFAILDAMYTSARVFLDNVTPTPTFPPLEVRWTAGGAGGTFWSGTFINILGDDGVDTDEFDVDVLAHEWAHYFEDTQSRTDSPGGAHGAGDLLDIRLAFSEGFGNAMAGIVFNLAGNVLIGTTVPLPFIDTMYIDTFWPGGPLGTAFSYDIEINTANDGSPGWFSEMSITRIVFDVFDGGAGDVVVDTVVFGYQGIYETMTHPLHMNTDALTSLFSFISAAKQVRSAQITNIDTLIGPFSFYQMRPIISAFGTAEDTVDGGLLVALPTYHGNLPGSSPSDDPLLFVGPGLPRFVTVGFVSAPFPNNFRANELQSNRYIYFFLTGGVGSQVTITTDCGAAVTVYQQGVPVGPPVTVPAADTIYSVVLTTTAVNGNCVVTLTLVP